MADFAGLSRNLGYEFSDPGLLDLALTHKSLGARNFERLEFLGDSVLGFIIADYLFRTFEGISEGKLSRMRARVVRRETLADISRTLDMGASVKLGEGELKSGGYRRDSILADALEAIIGAIYLDGGMDAASGFIHAHFDPVLQELNPGANYKDAKSRLQEALQARGLLLPDYRIVETAGSAHKQTFVVECSVGEMEKACRASGASRREAEQLAAEKMLESMV